jgi:hypothetical protein
VSEDPVDEGAEFTRVDEESLFASVAQAVVGDRDFGFLDEPEPD